MVDGWMDRGWWQTDGWMDGGRRGPRHQPCHATRRARATATATVSASHGQPWTAATAAAWLAGWLADERHAPQGTRTQAHVCTTDTALDGTARHWVAGQPSVCLRCLHCLHCLIGRCRRRGGGCARPCSAMQHDAAGRWACAMWHAAMDRWLADGRQPDTGT
ncbi:hypothetical protein BC831DRAFT_458948 [Entophlyctis helioformis]|nr:hypothetical protein BC831DRAFT_458948 [Entophlyctis helioformis]